MMVLALRGANPRSLGKRLPTNVLFPQLRLYVGSLEIFVELAPCPNWTGILGLLVLLFGLLVVSTLKKLFPRLHLLGLSGLGEVAFGLLLR